MADDAWLPEPEPGTAVAGGFDGSENNDWTAIKLETREGFLFTPRWGPDRRPTIWDPAESDGRIPRHEITLAWAELAARFRLVRVYCDPGFKDEMSWASEIDAWDEAHGPKVFSPWSMAGSTRIRPVYAALKRFEADLSHGRLTHDGCPITSTHVGNARKLARTGDQYILGKPSMNQKIDAGVTSVLAHEAASDARAAGWPEEQDNRVIIFA